MDFNREFSVGLLVLVGIYAGIYLNSDYFDVFTASFVDLRSEYTAVEQLSKFGLILSMLACLYSFHFTPVYIYLESNRELVRIAFNNLSQRKQYD
ncbi:hypothetical protein HNR64_002873 [Spongiibacter marinus]|nr:hypothetical protein [Spongiibacter marinus]